MELHLQHVNNTIKLIELMFALLGCHFKRSIKFNRPRPKPDLISPACGLFLIGGVLRHKGSKYLFCLLLHTSCKCLARKIVLLIFQYFLGSRVCFNRVELHCLALLLWINGYCSDMVLF